MWRRTLVVLGLALLHLLLAATVTLETADVAWAPSYIDGDDRDATRFSERLCALAGAPAGLIPLLAALAMVVARPPAAARRVAPARLRVRAPPRA